MAANILRLTHDDQTQKWQSLLFRQTHFMRKTLNDGLVDANNLSGKHVYNQIADPKNTISTNNL